MFTSDTINHKQRNPDFLKYRQQFPVFRYRQYQWKQQEDELHLSFDFELEGKARFQPRWVVPLNPEFFRGLNESLINNLVFHLGMVESISYWKATCSPFFIIEPFHLPPQAEQWWKKLFFMGLGEFFHTNGIVPPEIDQLLSFQYGNEARFLSDSSDIQTPDNILIPVGGGKDSLTSLAILSEDPRHKAAFAVNPGKATHESVAIAGLGNQFIITTRTFDKTLLQLNDEGFLNGHTPFSALLAFASILTATVNGFRHIALSNESSANEPTIPGTHINHQYSKSVDFENDFREYVQKYLLRGVNYFSLLRPINELQIASIFAGQQSFLPVFRSCNAGSKTNEWCCNCSKCLFTFTMLAPFAGIDKMTKVMGENLLEKNELLRVLWQLTGFADEKPFECIGTIDEVNAALTQISIQHKDALPLLVRKWEDVLKKTDNGIFKNHLNHWNEFHQLDETFQTLVKNALHTAKQTL